MTRLLPSAIGFAGCLGVTGCVGLVWIAPVALGAGTVVATALAWCWWIETHPLA